MDNDKVFANIFMPKDTILGFFSIKIGLIGGVI